MCRNHRADATGLPLGGGERPSSLTVTESVFETSTGLGADWEYWGWARSEYDKGAPARVDFSSYGGLILARPGLAGEFGGLLVRLQAPPAFGEFLEVFLDARRVSLPHVAIQARHLRPLPDGWLEAFLPMGELNPEGQPFDRVVFRAYREVGAEAVRFAAIGFTREGGAPPVMPADTPTRSARFKVSCAEPTHPISPLVYGIAYKPSDDASDKHQWLMGATARRWGGNPSSRFNWELGNAWNTASDWFFTNVNYTGDEGWSYERFLEDNRKRGVKTALTVPTLGWVAKDKRSYSFPVRVYGRQQELAPENADAGNGIAQGGKEIAPGSPERTSVAAPPESIGRWVRAIREHGAGERRVHMYILDNEPMLWNSTHRDVHPEPVSYDELLDRTIRYGAAVRQADPGAVIAGPALWGWPAYSYSAVDAKFGFSLAPDRRRHGDIPLLPWWLRALRDHENRTGQHLIDVVDVHFYPAAKGVAGEDGATDEATAAARIRSTRGLWDPTYKDESWIDDTVMLIPRLRKWIAENRPGLGISIGEWNFGAEHHRSGGLATAEALGRFGALGVEAAFYWTYPAANSPAFWAFRAYRNFDGQGGHFLERSLATEANSELASLFASRDGSGERVVAVLLNHDPKRALEATIDFEACGTISGPRAFVYAGGVAGFSATPIPPGPRGALVHTAPPYSISVLDMPTTPPSARP